MRQTSRQYTATTPTTARNWEQEQTAEYAETSAGLDIPFDAVNARYVRFYSNGSDKNASNHYVEAEIYGAKGAVVHPSTVSLSKTDRHPFYRSNRHTDSKGYAS